MALQAQEGGAAVPSAGSEGPARPPVGSCCGDQEVALPPEEALMRAVVLCDEEAALEAIAAGAGLGRKERETGYTALHHACQYGLASVAEALINAGAPLVARTRDLVLQNAVVQAAGQTPLHLAALSGEVEVVDLLLARRADASTSDIDGFNPAATAALHGKHQLAALLAGAARKAVPPQEELQAMVRAAKEAGKKRVAQMLFVPTHLREVYTLERVWSVEECTRVLAAVCAVTAVKAKATAGVAGHADGWTTERHTAYATTDVPCSAVPAVDGWVRGSLHERVFPQLARRHGWLPRCGSRGPQEEQSCGRVGDGIADEGSRLAFRDLFFVRYSAAPGCQRGLDVHRDGSIISFNLLLNSPSDFQGGGTYVEADDRAYTIAQGDCFVHSGKLRHGGHPVTQGERYVLVAFVDVLDDVEDADAPSVIATAGA